MKRTTHKTRRLEIRPLALKDYKQWYLAMSGCREKQNRWDHGPYAKKRLTKTIFRKQVSRLEYFAKKDEYYRYGVFHKKTGELLGQIDFDIFKRDTHQFANFGYSIFNQHWGNKYGQEAARRGLKIGFKELKLNRLEAAINLDNNVSIRLCKKIGMKREGIKRRYWYEFGKWTDHLIYVANPEDVGWKGRAP